MKRIGLLVLVFASLMLSLAGCDMFGFRSWSWHQKLTVTVETPDGPRSGSAVSAAWFQMTPKWSGVGDSAGASNSSLSGEAVVVDLGQGRYLFALLKGYNEFTGRLAFFPLPRKPLRKEEDAAVYDQLEALRASTELPRELTPLLVTFADIDDPASVARVDPDDLDASFGPGYALSSITIAITDEPVTQGKVEAVLGWINSDEVLTNPVWRSLPSLAQTAISGLKRPIGE
tara:strand:- start:1671 stop:2360 length:690 start_codon:yes stop_codon:yes gene_type:complete